MSAREEWQQVFVVVHGSPASCSATYTCRGHGRNVRGGGLGRMQMEDDVSAVKEQLAQALFDHIPVGVGSQGIIPTTAADLEAVLEMGMDWSLREVRLRRPRPQPLDPLTAVLSYKLRSLSL